jgi:hypothetical protein
MYQALQQQQPRDTGENRLLFPPTPLRTKTKPISGSVGTDLEGCVHKIAYLKDRIQKQSQTMQHQRLSVQDRNFISSNLVRDETLLQKVLAVYQERLQTQQESKQLILDTYLELSEMARDKYPEQFEEDCSVIKQVQTDLDTLRGQYASISSPHGK